MAAVKRAIPGSWTIPIMNPYETYRHQRASGWTRIDMLLALYDGAVSRLEEAGDALSKDDAAAAAPALLRAQRIVVELLAGIDLRYGDVPQNLQRLYAFVLVSIGVGTASEVAGALEVLRTLREGLIEVRAEAVALERSGAIPSADSGRTLHATG
jgi:flagellin-specific chaperone FliS